MCGLFGAFGTKGKLNVTDFLRQAAMCDSLRGGQATGAAIVSVGDDAPTIMKRAMHGADFVRDTACRAFLNYTDKTMVVMGHNRAATTGQNIDKNAHPFSREHITLTHNGHFSNAWALGTKAGLRSTDWDVDSDTACAVIAAHGAEAALPMLGGAYAIVWFDAKDRSLNFATNGDRPLVFAESVSSDHKLMLYGSERGMLEWLAARNGIPIVRWYTLRKDQVVKFMFNEDGSWTKPVTRKYKPDPITYESPARNYWNTSAGSSTDEVGVRQHYMLEKFLADDIGAEIGKTHTLSVYDDRDTGNAIILDCESLVSSLVKCTISIPKSVYPRLAAYIQEQMASDSLHYIDAVISSIGFTGGPGLASDIFNEGRGVLRVSTPTIEFLDERMQHIEFASSFVGADKSTSTGQQSGGTSNTSGSSGPDAKPASPVHVSRRQHMKQGRLIPATGSVFYVTDAPARIGHVDSGIKNGDLLMYVSLSATDRNLWVMQQSGLGRKLKELSPKRMRPATTEEAARYTKETLPNLRIVH